jgi:hypothetical protein
MSATAVDRFLLGCYEEFLVSLRTAPTRQAYLTAGAAGLGLVGTTFAWVCYLWSNRIDPGAAQHALREAAGVAAGLGIPLVFVGLVGLLTAGPTPTRRGFRSTTVGGTLVAWVGVALFALGYPARWDVPAGPDLAPLAVTCWGLGVASVLFVVGAAAGCRCSLATR